MLPDDEFIGESDDSNGLEQTDKSYYSLQDSNENFHILYDDSNAELYDDSNAKWCLKKKKIFCRRLKT